MLTRIRRWGNSLAVHIPKSFALEARLKPDGLVDVTVADGKLVVAPITEPRITLDELLARVTDDNLHGEVDTGPARGREAW